MTFGERTAFAAMTAAVVSVVTISGAVKFTGMFKSPDASSVNFAGKRVAALVITQDDSLRVAGEESLVRELNLRGMEGVATYRIAPKEELARADTARPWFEKAHIEGVVAIRPVSAETTRTYTPSTWVNPYYGTLWDYYGYGWGAVYIPSSTRKETLVVVETTIYDLPRNKLVWAAVTETKNPRDLRGFVEELVKASVAEMQKQGLAKRQSR